ncbi:MAG: thiamine pyrophosphate-dependent enzyme [Candidatus Heimdallarchaeota archaeon]
MDLLVDTVGQICLMSGNAAIARGAIEAGVNFSTSYPGSPVWQVSSLLAEAAVEAGMHAEWSTNEIVALEAATAASLAGLRAICVMKYNGLNVVSDFLLTMMMHLKGALQGGLVLVVGDDPSGHSSISEQDSRFTVQLAEVPLLEPATFQEAKDMTRWAFELSELLHQIIVIRVVTRLAHSQGVVKLGSIDRTERKGTVPEGHVTTYPPIISHPLMHEKLQQAQKAFEESTYNSYEGSADASLVMITSGPSWKYCQEARQMLGVGSEVGVLKLGTLWPLPERFIVRHLKHAQTVLFVEELDPFIERNVMALAAEHGSRGVGPITFFGKKSGHVAGPKGPGVGEMTPDIVIRALAAVRDVELKEEYKGFRLAAEERVGHMVPPRTLALCAGCPHRASFWAIRNALKVYGRKGFVAGDIGCYTLGLFPTGYSVLQSCYCMGSGVGIANGMGNLTKFGVDEPVVAVIGDSTFWHAGIPALINAKYNQVKMTLVVLDNSATAMTGFQPHPGIGRDAMGRAAPTVDIAALCQGLGIDVIEGDPYNVEETTETLYDLLEKGGLNVLVLKQPCALLKTRMHPERVKRVYVDTERCVGETCGCNQFCVRGFGCPGIFWDKAARKAQVDDVVCTGCGVCASLCSHGAIVIEAPREVGQ